MVNEKAIENNILSYLKIKGIFCWQNATVGIFDQRLGRYRRNKSPHHLNGVSDIIAILPDGRACFIEVKSPKGRLSPHQETFLNNATRHGALAFVARSINEVEEKLKSYWDMP